MFLRNIFDINISDNKISITRNIDLKVQDLESQIGKLRYERASNDKNNKVENAKLPPFVQVFYYLFFSTFKVPDLETFWNTYVSWLGGENTLGQIEINSVTYSSSDIKNRLNRTYPSLIRDLHFLYLIEDSKLFTKVSYSLKKDYFNGLDLGIIHNNKEYYISLMIDTQRSRYFKKRKTERHDYSIFNEIEFIVSFDSLTKKGDIYLLNQSHITLLLKLLNEN